MDMYLGVDQGSHSSRAVLFDERGREQASADCKIKIERNGAHAEYDATQLLESVQYVVSQLLDQNTSRSFGNIKACGLATQRSTVLMWDDQGKALSPALSWQDTRASEQVYALSQHEKDVHRLTGLPLTPYYSASKINWLLNNASVIQSNSISPRVSPLVSYLMFHLLEKQSYVVDYSNAQRTQLFDIHSMHWSPELCQIFSVEKHYLPKCMPMCSDYGMLKGTDIPLTTVCGDQNAALFGSVNINDRSALVNIGSGAFILRKLESYSDNPDLLTGIAYADAEHIEYLREATINGAGNALTWAVEHWGIENIDKQLPRWLVEIEQPPVFVNTVGGLGTPWMTAGIEPYLAGNADSSAEIAVAVIESIVFLLQANLERLQQESVIEQLVVSGGLSNLDGLCQKLGNLSGLRIERPQQTEATARGVAWLAAGCPDSWHEFTETTVFEPHSDEALKQRYTVFIQELTQRINA